ncbi:RNA-binding protein NOB1 [Aphelenchoides fujianensis]|nr:RNA-binding protein NOB1 [Aphelenchoides fujianensis]
MRSADEVPVNHLVVDASAFIKNAPLHDIGAKIYTIPEVVGEIRDRATRERMKCLPFELLQQSPTAESLNIVMEISKKTGDYPALSLTDLKLLALAHDLHVRYAGKETINYEVKSLLDVIEDERPDAATEKTPFGFVMPSNAANGESDEDEDDDEGWVDESNLVSVLGEEYGVADKIDGHMPVAVISSDFALQNVLMHMKMHLVSIEGLVIKQLKSFVLRCRQVPVFLTPFLSTCFRACYKLTSRMEREFCQKCGNKSLDRVAVSVDSDGHVQVHLNRQKMENKRATAPQMRTIKGGKHDNPDKFFEDQRMPQNRASKMAELQDSMGDAPFAKHDVTSRSAILGIRPNRRVKSGRRR